MENLINEPKTTRGKKTFDRILSAADQLFYRNGYHDTAVLDITKEAGVALGTFYIYFNDKLSLYKYLLLQYSHEIRKAIHIATEGSSSRFEKEKLGMRAFLEFIRERPSAYNIIWNSLYIDKQLFVNYYEDFSRRYEKGILEAQKDGTMIEENSTVISYMLMGMVNFIGLKYGIFENSQPLDEIVDVMMKVLYNGVFKV